MDETNTYEFAKETKARMEQAKRPQVAPVAAQPKVCPACNGTGVKEE